jgi:hypothetical protein
MKRLSRKLSRIPIGICGSGDIATGRWQLGPLSFRFIPPGELRFNDKAPLPTTTLAQDFGVPASGKFLFVVRSFIRISLRHRATLTRFIIFSKSGV